MRAEAVSNAFMDPPRALLTAEENELMAGLR
jgi:hypothetical protein